MYSLPVLVTSTLTFDTDSDKLVKGESAIVYAIEDGSGGHGKYWHMMSVDRPRLIRHYFGPHPDQVFKNWLRPVA